LEDVGEEFRGATLTADAGLTAILKTDRLEKAGMEGLIQIKGNAGMAFDEVKDLPWDKVTEQSTTDETGHGRHEIRIAKMLPLMFVEDEVEIISDISENNSATPKTESVRVRNNKILNKYETSR
jgi:hypothetical protein